MVIQPTGISFLKTVSTTIIFFASISLYSQKDFNFSGHSIEIGGIYTLRNRVSPIPNGKDGVSLRTRAQVGFELNLSKIISVKNNWAINFSYIFGAYPFDIKYDIEKEFTGLSDNINNLSNSISYIKYTGAGLGFIRFFTLSKNLFSINGNWNFIYFMGDWNLQERYSEDIHPDNLVYKILFIPNRDGNIIVAPSLKLNFYKQIKNRLWLYTFLTGTLSSKKVLSGTYKVIGENEILNGTFDKKYSHIGIGIGVHYMKKEK